MAGAECEAFSLTSSSMFAEGRTLRACPWAFVVEHSTHWELSVPSGLVAEEFAVDLAGSEVAETRPLPSLFFESSSSSLWRLVGESAAWEAEGSRLSPEALLAVIEELMAT